MRKQVIIIWVMSSLALGSFLLCPRNVCADTISGWASASIVGSLSGNNLIASDFGLKSYARAYNSKPQFSEDFGDTSAKASEDWTYANTESSIRRSQSGSKINYLLSTFATIHGLPASEGGGADAIALTESYCFTPSVSGKYTLTGYIFIDMSTPSSNAQWMYTNGIVGLYLIPESNDGTFSHDNEGTFGQEYYQYRDLDGQSSKSINEKYNYEWELQGGITYNLYILARADVEANLTFPVPEPTSILLLGLGLIALAGLRKMLET